MTKIRLPKKAKTQPANLDTLTVSSEQEAEIVNEHMTDGSTAEVGDTVAHDVANGTFSQLEEAPAAKTVTVTLAMRKESPAYLEVVIGEQVSWLQKSSLTLWAIGGEGEAQQVEVTMPRSYAKRRGLLAAA